MRKQIPILFSTPMVQAILDGRKTMTRRKIKSRHESGLFQVNRRVSDGQITDINSLDWDERNCEKDITCPYGQPGDILWVRESAANLNVDFPSVEPYWIYKADIQIKDQHGPVTWKPSIHMPKSACRIWLEITDVRVERLQDMDGAHAEECDSLKEGIMKFHHGDGNYGYHWKGDMDGKNFVHPFDAFVDLWKSINGPESWEANPWVWVVEFKILSTTGKPSDI